MLVVATWRNEHTGNNKHGFIQERSNFPSFSLYLKDFILNFLSKFYSRIIIVISVLSPEHVGQLHDVDVVLLLEVISWMHLWRRINKRADVAVISILDHNDVLVTS